MPGENPLRRGTGRFRRPIRIPAKRLPSNARAGRSPRGAALLASRGSLAASPRHALLSRRPQRTRRARRRADRPFAGQHGRGHAARRLRRRHGRRAAVGHLADPRARPHRRGECRAARPASPTSTPRCSAPTRCSTCATSASSSGAATSRKPELHRRAAARDRRAGGARRLPRLRPLADAALGGRARTRDRRAAREGDDLRPGRRDADRRAARGAGPQDRLACHRALHLAVREPARAGPAAARATSGWPPTTTTCSA